MYENITKKTLPDKRYTLQNDVNMRLAKTILMYDGKPVYCYGSYEDSLSVLLVYLTSAKTLNEKFVVHSSDVLLDISSPALGWYNHGEAPMYLCRAPLRSQRQGLYLPHIDYLSPYHNTAFNRGLNLGLMEMIRVSDCILGVFPPIHECLVGSGGAFDRDWALVYQGPKHFTIYHKHIPVGTFFKDTGTFFFRAGRLTKTRRNSLEALIFSQKNGASYGIKEQTVA